MPNLRTGKNTGQCIVDGCESRRWARRLCAKHSRLWYYRAEDRSRDPPSDPKFYAMRTVEERFWRYVDKSDGCWIWKGYVGTGGKGGDKYGWFYNVAKGIAAHRFSYELANGKIPHGYQIDHLCRVTECVNPSHLEAVTPRVNVMRSRSTASLNAKKTHCKRGHELSGENLILRKNRQRQCRICYVMHYENNNLKRKNLHGNASGAI